MWSSSSERDVDSLYRYRRKDIDGWSFVFCVIECKQRSSKQLSSRTEWGKLINRYADKSLSDCALYCEEEASSLAWSWVFSSIRHGLELAQPLSHHRIASWTDSNDDYYYGKLKREERETTAQRKLTRRKKKDSVNYQIFNVNFHYGRRVPSHKDVKWSG